jgi:cobyric acid synthase
MKGLGVVDVHKWKTDELNVDNNYEEKNKRFRKAVKDVIEQLKQENKIVYKSIAERMKTAF